jgi:hypothetical protein
LKPANLLLRPDRSLQSDLDLIIRVGSKVSCCIICHVILRVADIPSKEQQLLQVCYTAGNFCSSSVDLLRSKPGSKVNCQLICKFGLQVGSCTEGF